LTQKNPYLIVNKPNGTDASKDCSSPFTVIVNHISMSTYPFQSVRMQCAILSFIIKDMRTVRNIKLFEVYFLACISLYDFLAVRGDGKIISKWEGSVTL